MSVIGAPLTLGQPFEGVDKGPCQVREAGLLDMLRKLDYRIEECGNLNFDKVRPGDPVLSAKDGRAKNCFAVGNACQKLSNIVQQKQREEKFSLVLGGDHSVGAGTISGACG